MNPRIKRCINIEHKNKKDKDAIEVKKKYLIELLCNIKNELCNKKMIQYLGFTNNSVNCEH